MSIHAFPRCASYLKAMRVKLDDPSMTDYWFAVILSDKWADEELAKRGTVDFATMDGTAILGEFEKLLTGKPKRSKLKGSEMNRLKAFFGSRGVKVSRLKGGDEYWEAACILWPDHIKGHGHLSNLLKQIEGMTKRQRSSAAEHVCDLPAKWRAA